MTGLKKHICLSALLFNERAFKSDSQLAATKYPMQHTHGHGCNTICLETTALETWIEKQLLETQKLTKQQVNSRNTIQGASVIETVNSASRIKELQQQPHG